MDKSSNARYTVMSENLLTAKTITLWQLC